MCKYPSLILLIDTCYANKKRYRNHLILYDRRKETKYLVILINLNNQKIIMSSYQNFITPIIEYFMWLQNKFVYTNIIWPHNIYGAAVYSVYCN